MKLAYVENLNIVSFFLKRVNARFIRYGKILVA